MRPRHWFACGETLLRPADVQVEAFARWGTSSRRTVAPVELGAETVGPAIRRAAPGRQPDAFRAANGAGRSPSGQEFGQHLRRRRSCARLRGFRSLRVEHSAGGEIEL